MSNPKDVRAERAGALPLTAFTPVELTVTIVAIIGAVALVYAPTLHYGFFSDDFNWLVGAEVFNPRRIVDLANRDHFYRPIVEIYFPLAMSACGRSSVCFHGLSLLLHLGTSVMVVVMARALSRTSAIGILAGVLFAAMPGPIEAVIWVSAVSEVLATLFFVLTVWLFQRVRLTGSRWSYVLSMLSFVASMLSHESGVTLLPLLIVLIWLMPLDADRRTGAMPYWRELRLLVPFAVALAFYFVITYVVNSRNYVVTEHQYGLGLHILPNILAALVTLAVARRDAIGMLMVAAFYIWAAGFAPRRVRFFALWTIGTLIPFAGFHGGLSSRYLYLPAAGFAALTAEMLWWLYQSLRGWPHAARIGWALLVLLVTFRFGAFAVKNTQVWRNESAPYAQYASEVRARYPALTPGAQIIVPAPPVKAFAPHYVQPLLQWELGDPTLTVTIAR